MEILKDSNTMLISNTELLLFMSSTKSNYPKTQMEFRGKTASYLEQNGVQLDKIGGLGGKVEELKKWKLTDQEVVQILNLLPRTIVHLHLIIANVGERFSDEDLGKIITEIIDKLRS